MQTFLKQMQWIRVTRYAFVVVVVLILKSKHEWQSDNKTRCFVPCISTKVEQEIAVVHWEWSSPPPPPFCNPNSPCSFLKPRVHGKKKKKKASIALRYRRLALVKAVSVSSSRAFFFLFLFAARLKTHARETKAMQTQSLGVAKRWEKKYIARGGGGRRTWTLTKQHVELAPSLPTVQSLSFD